MDLRSPNHAPDSDELRGISLCAGYAGLDLGLHIAESEYRTVAYVEREAHAAATLVARMEDAALAQAPVWNDLRSFDGRPWRGRVHCLLAGYPCQPFTYSGRREGNADPRHLWPEVARIAAEVEPEWIFAENVEGHVTLGLADVGRDLARLGYRAKAGLFTAREVGASHRRRRVFILAHSNSVRFGQLSGYRSCERGVDPGQAELPYGAERGTSPAFGSDPELDSILAGDKSAGLCAGADQCGGAGFFAPGPAELSAWQGVLAERPDLQPAILRMGDGLADRLERTRAAGNGVCSLAAAIAWRTLKAAHCAEWASGG